MSVFHYKSLLLVLLHLNVVGRTEIAHFLVPAALLPLIQLLTPMLIEDLSEVVMVFVHLLRDVNHHFSVVDACDHTCLLGPHDNHSVTNVVVFGLSSQVWQWQNPCLSFGHAMGG